MKRGVEVIKQEPVEPKQTRTERALLLDLPVFEIEDLLNNVGYDLQLVDVQYHGIIFRLRYASQVDVTLKIMRSVGSVTDGYLERLFAKADKRYEKEDFPQGADLSAVQAHKLSLNQAAGHMLGHRTTPTYIDQPFCIWNCNFSSASLSLGYSIPFVSGQPIRICRDPELDRVADVIESRHNLYVGDRGSWNDSYNAIVSGPTKKFIDVQLNKQRNLVCNRPSRLNLST